MNEAYNSNVEKEVKKSAATDVAAMEARLAQQMQANHEALMRAQEELSSRRKKKGIRHTVVQQFPECNIDLAQSMLGIIKKKGSHADDGGNVMYQFRRNVVRGAHVKKDFSGYVWTDHMTLNVGKFIMRNASRVYPHDMAKIAYSQLSDERKTKFIDLVVLPHVMEWRRIFLSDFRTFARKAFCQIEGIDKDKVEDTDFASDIEHRAWLLMNKKQDSVVKDYFEPITGWFNRPTFVIFLAKILQNLQTYGNYGLRDLSVTDIVFHCDAVSQHFLGARPAGTNRCVLSFIVFFLLFLMLLFQVESKPSDIARRCHRPVDEAPGRVLAVA